MKRPNTCHFCGAAKKTNCRFCRCEHPGCTYEISSESSKVCYYHGLRCLTCDRALFSEIREFDNCNKCTCVDCGEVTINMKIFKSRRKQIVKVKCLNCLCLVEGCQEKRNQPFSVCAQHHCQKCEDVQAEGGYFSKANHLYHVTPTKASFPFEQISECYTQYQKCQTVDLLLNPDSWCTIYNPLQPHLKLCVPCYTKNRCASLGNCPNLKSKDCDYCEDCGQEIACPSCGVKNFMDVHKPSKMCLDCSQQKTSCRNCSKVYDQNDKQIVRDHPLKLPICKSCM